MREERYLRKVRKNQLDLIAYLLPTIDFSSKNERKKMNASIFFHFHPMPRRRLSKLLENNIEDFSDSEMTLPTCDLTRWEILGKFFAMGSKKIKIEIMEQ